MTDIAVSTNPTRVEVRQTVAPVTVVARPVQVAVEQPVQRVEVVHQPVQVVVLTGGPRGEPGGSYYEHTQSTPSTTWTINHNLGYRPSVELRTTGGQEFDADIQHPTVNQVVVTLNTALAGYARLT